MGYTRRPGTEITDFWPDDTDTEIYISCSAFNPRLKEIMDRIEEKWPGTNPDDIEIGGQEIHTRCLGYDLYDPGDWTDFIIIRKINA